MKQAEDPVAKLTADPGFRVKCPSCGHDDAVPEDPSQRTYTCDHCGCTIACGCEMPRIFIMPRPDRRFITLRMASGAAKGAGCFEHDITVPLERRYAVGVAIDLLSTSDPPMFKEFLAYLAAKKALAAAGSPTPAGTPAPSDEAPGEALVTLDRSTLD